MNTQTVERGRWWGGGRGGSSDLADGSSRIPRLLKGVGGGGVGWG